MKKYSLLVLFFLVITLLFVTVNYFVLPEQSHLSEESDTLGGDFSIPTENGIFHLKDYREKIVILYFGFASCPDACPTALAFTGNILKKLPENVMEQIQPLFISVDSARDGMKKLTNYGHYFHPKMISGTDSQASIDKLVRQYGAFYKINKQQSSAMDYSVDHSSQLYIIDKKGLLVTTITHVDIQSTLTDTLLNLTKDKG